MAAYCTKLHRQIATVLITEWGKAADKIQSASYVYIGSDILEKRTKNKRGKCCTFSDPASPVLSGRKGSLRQTQRPGDASVSERRWCLALTETGVWIRLWLLAPLPWCYFTTRARGRHTILSQYKSLEFELHGKEWHLSVKRELLCTDDALREMKKIWGSNRKIWYIEK